MLYVQLTGQQKLPLSSFKKKTVTAILKPQPEIDEDMEQIYAFAMKNAKLNIAFISKDISLIPYLTLLDNLLLGTSVNPKEFRLQIKQLLFEFGMNERMLADTINEIPLFVLLKMQLVRATLCSRKLIFVENVFDDLSIAERQELLLLLKKSAMDNQLAIVILTTDEQLAHSSYIDQILAS